MTPPECANLECSETPDSRLRYQAPDGTRHTYLLCTLHTDHAHHWLAGRPHLAMTAVSEHITPLAEQPALF